MLVRGRTAIIAILGPVHRLSFGPSWSRDLLLHGRQHFLNFFPLPQGQGSFRPTPFERIFVGLLEATDAL
jgi:hypothetical protein